MGTELKGSKTSLPAACPKYTPEAGQIIVNAIKIGSSFRGAAHAAGISEDAFRIWRDEHPAFMVEVKKALAELRLAHLARIERAANKDWRAAAWILERRFPEEYGRS